MLDKQHSSSTIKVYAAAIAASHAPIAGRSVGRDIAVTQYLRGARRMNPPRPRTVPPWDLATVLTLFVPFQSLSLRVLTLKPALLLALASVKRVGDLQALSVNPVCLEFGPLKPRLGYVPKVHLGHGPAGCPFQTFVRRLAGPCHPHLQGFTTWMSPLAGQSSFCLSSNISGSLDQLCLSPS